MTATGLVELAQALMQPGLCEVSEHMLSVLCSRSTQARAVDRCLTGRYG